ncbi:acyltransferase [Metabacillus sp. GX 13764]|uniref:acyltransferase n=1 Tax=Metabacillus kandeliae TaxID=2900151 RepID=UPI001E49E23A|nr:acyltransferase [Metabacillus kandeliae]MCD7033157.1 acyltransferase [Metabacillus kandeliae]
MNRNHSIDLIKFFAIFLVVCIHTAPFSKINLGFINGSNITFILNTFGRFAVPYFFIISGYLYGIKNNKYEFYNKYTFKYLLNLFRIYLGWAVFYVLYDFFLNCMHGINIQIEALQFINKIMNLKTLYLNGISSRHAYQLWYLVALIISILIIWVFIKLDKIKLLLIISLGLNLIGLFGEGQSYSQFFNAHIITRDALFYGLFYTTLGFFFANNTFIPTQNPYVYLKLFFLFFFGQFIERFVLVYLFQAPQGDYYVFTIPQTIFLFLFVVSCRNVKDNFLAKIGSNAVGIFVIHTFVISVIKDIILGETFFENIIADTVVGQLLYTPIVFISSYYLYTSIQLIKKKINYISYRNVINETKKAG